MLFSIYKQKQRHLTLTMSCKYLIYYKFRIATLSRFFTEIASESFSIHGQQLVSAPQLYVP